MSDQSTIAYFSMEIGLESAIPTYAGGLGALAGDTIRSAADLEVPMVAMTLLHHRGFFHQRLDGNGCQTEEPVFWSPQDVFEALAPRTAVDIAGRSVVVRAWRFIIRGITGFSVPVLLLDSDLPENTPEDRRLTDVLYGGDSAYRLGQEIVLGIGGVRMLRALGYEHITHFHLNEGHAALLTLALAEELQKAQKTETAILSEPILEAVRARCVFTTHTPVPAGHDQFPAELVQRLLGRPYCDWLRGWGQMTGLNMTELALHCSRFINGVAMKHGEVSRGMFPGYPIHSITNGVHAPTWVAPSFHKLFEAYLPGWRNDTLLLRYAVGIPDAALWSAHTEAKRELLAFVNRATNAGFSREVCTLGFARRATAYKRATLIFQDLQRLREIAAQVGPLQVVFAGKAHPRDDEGKQAIQAIYEAQKALRGTVAIAYIPNYDMALAKLLCAGVDVWLNTPLPPWEASGTSGMKAALNGVPSLSVLDGWWIEGHVEGITGWAIGEYTAPQTQSPHEVAVQHSLALYEALATRVLPCFYQKREQFVAMMRYTIMLNGSFFNTQRMVWQYLHNAYRLSPSALFKL